VKVHHLDCATMCPLGGRWLGGVDRMVGHCLLIEAPAGLVLVDTGFGLLDAQRLPLGFRLVARPMLAPERTAVHQLRALGLDPRDVRDVIVTHLDVDHAGGLADFPEARVHLQDLEHQGAYSRSTLRERLRYVPAHWGHEPRWVRHTPRGERWRGFEAVTAIEGLPPEILLVPMSGHSRGHQAVAVDTGSGWLLHAGDQYPHRGRIEDGVRCPPGLVAFERSIAHDHGAVRANQERLRALKRESSDLTVFSAHDAVEYDRLSQVATPP
jgi:glyoxylase-like metal-dependent hydrolase (beta-lactamase superfamily II)